ncbi:10914_t:CDS:2, partial [Ambispora leptoticha]
EYQRLPKRIRQVIQEALAFNPDPQLGIFKTARAAYQEQINQLSSPAKNEPESIKTHRLKQLAKIQEDLKYLDIFLQGD